MVLHSPFNMNSKGGVKKEVLKSLALFEAPQFKEESQKRTKNAIYFLVCPRGLLWTREAYKEVFQFCSNSCEIPPHPHSQTS